MQKENICIRQRKNGSYEARVTVDGTRHSLYGMSKSEVKRKAKSLLQKCEREEVIAQSIRLGTALESYLENIKRNKVKATTYDRVESTFQYHIKDEALGRMQIGTITALDIQKLLADQCKKGLSESSIKKM